MESSTGRTRAEVAGRLVPEPAKRARAPRIRLVASDPKPWIHAHALDAHAFCRRAAVLVHEAGLADTGEDHAGAGGRSSPAAAVGWLWARPDTARALRRSALRASGLLAALVLAAGAWPVTGARTGAPATWLVASGLALAAVLALVRLSVLGAAALRADRARPLPPDAAGRDGEPISWWSLLRSGFEPRTPAETLRDPLLRLAGRPWRVLVRGRVEIPVLRLRGAADDAAGVRRLHGARAAAYCHLLEAAHDTRSPYAVALLGRGDWGVAIPVPAHAGDALDDALRSLRETVARAARDRRGAVARPPEPERCLDCPLGRPEPGSFYSACGARFRWRPPHRLVLRRTRG